MNRKEVHYAKNGDMSALNKNIERYQRDNDNISTLVNMNQVKKIVLTSTI